MQGVDCDACVYGKNIKKVKSEKLKIKDFVSIIIKAKMKTI